MAENIYSLEDMENLYNDLLGLTRNKEIPIYIVESNFIVKKLLKNSFEHLGFSQIEISMGGTELLNFLKSVEETQLVVYSLTDKQLNGIAFLNQLNAVKYHLPIKIIMITNPADTEALEKIKTLGVDAFIFKPIELKNVIEALQVVELL